MCLWFGLSNTTRMNIYNVPIHQTTRLRKTMPRREKLVIDIQPYRNLPSFRGFASNCPHLKTHRRLSNRRLRRSSHVLRMEGRGPHVRFQATLSFQWLMRERYNRYLAVAARVVRRSLKEGPRLQAERRGEMELRFAKWEVSFRN